MCTIISLKGAHLFCCCWQNLFRRLSFKTVCMSSDHTPKPQSNLNKNNIKGLSTKFTPNIAAAGGTLCFNKWKGLSQKKKKKNPDYALISTPLKKANIVVLFLLTPSSASVVFAPKWQWSLLHVQPDVGYTLFCDLLILTLVKICEEKINVFHIFCHSEVEVLW